MKSFFALLRLQMLSRYADLRPRNLKNALKEKRGRTVGMFLAFLALIIYLGVILYILETKALDFLASAGKAGVLLDMAIMLGTMGTLVMAFFFIMSSLYLGRDGAFLAAMPIRPRILLGAKLTQVWISETLIDAVILLPACILYGLRTGVGAGFYFRMVIVWLLLAILPICIAAVFSALLTRLSALWKHREIFMTVGGILLFAAYMVLMMNMGSITGSSQDSAEMIQKFFEANSDRIAGLTRFFPPADWAARGLQGNWGQLALYAAVSIGAAALLVGVLGIFYRKLSLLQSETPQASGKKGIQKGSIHEGSAFLANVKREILLIFRVPSYAVNILPVSLMPILMVVMIGGMIGRTASGGGEAKSVSDLLATLPAAPVMCILAAMIAYMSGMNPALSTAVSREGKGHDFIKALPVSSRTIILAKLAVGYALQATGVIGAGIAITIIVPGFLTETILAVVLCLIFDLGCACMALSRDVRKPRLDWVTEQEAVKQNFGVMISMLVSWGILIALAGLSVLMIHVLGMGMIPVFAVLGVLLALLLWISYRKLMKNVDQYYCAG